MKQFSKLSLEKTRENFIYSELLALAYYNVEFFNFVGEERNKYLMNDKVFENQFVYEFRKYPISIEIDKVPIFPISIEKDWDLLKDVYYSAIEIRNIIPMCEHITIKTDNCLLFDDKIVAGKSKTDMIILSDLESVLGVTKEQIYTNDIDSLVVNTITIFQQYMKPEFLNIMNYFLDIFEESGLDMNYSNYKNFKVNGLGIKIEALPKLCYNNLADFCKDVSDYEPAFRDYTLMCDILSDFKHQNFNKEILLPMIKGVEKNSAFVNIVSKIYGLKKESYYRIDSKNKLVILPSMDEYIGGEIVEKYSIDKKKNFYLSLVCENIEVKICVEIGLVPYDIEISNKLIENVDYERF